MMGVKTKRARGHCVVVHDPMPDHFHKSRRRRSALREAAPCILTIVVFVIPLAVLVCLKFAQLVGYFPIK